MAVPSWCMWGITAKTVALPEKVQPPSTTWPLVMGGIEKSAGPASTTSARFSTSASGMVTTSMPLLPVSTSVPVLKRCRFTRTCAPAGISTATPSGRISGSVPTPEP